MYRHFLALLALLWACAAVSHADEPTWKAGFAKVPITPDKPQWMSGYAGRTTPAEGKETELWAKAAVLQDGKGNKIVLVTLDLVGIDRDLSQAVCKLIQDKLKISREAVALSVSHTHCGPVVGTNLRAMYMLSPEHSALVDEYTTKLPSVILRAVNAANEKLAPVKLTWSIGKAGFAVNRRENKEPEVPKLREMGALKGPIDHDVPVLAAHDGKSGKLTGVVFGYACHATVLSYQKWCGDYPGFAMIDLEAAHPGAVAMFFAGCGADQNPLPRRTVELAKNYGQQLAKAVETELAKPMKAVGADWKGVYREIDLPLHEIPTREHLIKESMDTNKYIAARAKMLLKKLESDGSIPKNYPYPVQTWKLGSEISWVILGGEVVVDYSLRIKKELGQQSWVMGYANDVMAYIPSARVLKEGGYEGASSMIYYGLPSVWGPRVEELIMAESHKQAKTLQSK